MTLTLLERLNRIDNALADNVLKIGEMRERRKKIGLYGGSTASEFDALCREIADLIDSSRQLERDYTATIDEFRNRP